MARSRTSVGSMTFRPRPTAGFLDAIRNGDRVRMARGESMEHRFQRRAVHVSASLSFLGAAAGLVLAAGAVGAAAPVPTFEPICFGTTPGSFLPVNGTGTTGPTGGTGATGC